MRNFDATIISQYYSSPVLTQILTNLNTYIDPDADLEQFYTLIWNIDSAQGYGLDVWGRIVGVSRVLTNVPSGDYLWFDEALPGTAFGFGQAPFYSGQPATDNFTLTDQAFRLLIFAKAAANICDGSIGSINQILMNLFPGRGNAYVTDGRNGPLAGDYFGFEEANALGFGQAPFGDFISFHAGNNMTMVYTFTFALQPFELAIVQSGVLPKPAGVLASVSVPA